MFSLVRQYSRFIWEYIDLERHKRDFYDFENMLYCICVMFRSNQLILKEINPEYSSEGLMMKLKLQYFDHLM